MPDFPNIPTSSFRPSAYRRSESNAPKTNNASTPAASTKTASKSKLASISATDLFMPKQARLSSLDLRTPAQSNHLNILTTDGLSTLTNNDKSSSEQLDFCKITASQYSPYGKNVKISQTSAGAVLKLVETWKPDNTAFHTQVAAINSVRARLTGVTPLQRPAAFKSSQNYRTQTGSFNRPAPSLSSKRPRPVARNTSSAIPRSVKALATPHDAKTQDARTISHLMAIDNNIRNDARLEQGLNPLDFSGNELTYKIDKQFNYLLASSENGDDLGLAVIGRPLKDDNTISVDLQFLTINPNKSENIKGVGKSLIRSICESVSTALNDDKAPKFIKLEAHSRNAFDAFKHMGFEFKPGPNRDFSSYAVSSNGNWPMVLDIDQYLDSKPSAPQT